MQIAKTLGLMADMWSEVPRTSYHGVVTVRLYGTKRSDSRQSAGVLVHIAPLNIPKVILLSGFSNLELNLEVYVHHPILLFWVSFLGQGSRVF